MANKKLTSEQLYIIFKVQIFIGSKQLVNVIN